MNEPAEKCLAKSGIDTLKRKLEYMLNDPSAVEDTIQDACLRALEFDAADEEIRNPAAFLRRVATNIAIDQIRRQGLTRRIFIEIDSSEDVHSQFLSVPDAEVIADERFFQKQKIAAVMAAVDELPEKCRKVYLLSCVDQKTYSEISAEIGVSVSMIEKYVTRARRHVHAKVSPDCTLLN